MTSLGVPVVTRRVSAIWDTRSKSSCAAGVGSNCRGISCASRRFCVSRNHCERVCRMPLLDGAGSQVFRTQSAVLGDAGEHARADLFTVMEGEDQVGPARTAPVSYTHLRAHET